MSTTYPSNLSDAEWDCLQRFLPPWSQRGRLRRHSLRSVFEALFYLLRTGWPWRYLPSNFPPWQTVYYHFKQFCRTGLWTLVYRALRDAERQRVGRNPDPTAAIMDAQSVKTVEESGRIRGYDAHKCVKGRKRHLLLDTLGLSLSFYITPANVHDAFGARCLLTGLKYFIPRLTKIWADQAYQGHTWLTGAEPRAAGSSTWSSACQGCAAGASNRADGSLNAHLLGCPGVGA